MKFRSLATAALTLLIAGITPPTAQAQGCGDPYNPAPAPKTGST